MTDEANNSGQAVPPELMQQAVAATEAVRVYLANVQSVDLGLQIKDVSRQLAVLMNGSRTAEAVRLASQYQDASRIKALSAQISAAASSRLVEAFAAAQQAHVREARVALRAETLLQATATVTRPAEVVVSDDTLELDVGQILGQVAREGFTGPSPLAVLIALLVVVSFAVAGAEMKLPPQLLQLLLTGTGNLAVALGLLGAIKPPSG